MRKKGEIGDSGAADGNDKQAAARLSTSLTWGDSEKL